MDKMILNNYQNSFKYVVPFDFMLTDSIVMNKSTGFQSTFQVTFYDLNYLSDEELKQKIVKFNNAIKKLPVGFTLQVETNRSKSSEYPRKNLKNKPIPTQLIDEVRYESIHNETFYKTDYYITLTYIVSNNTNQKIEQLFEKDMSIFSKKNKNVKKQTDIEMLEEYNQLMNKELREFIVNRDLFQNALSKVLCLDVELLTNDKLLGYLYSAINLDKKEYIKTPHLSQIMLDDYLTASQILNSDNVKINDKYVKCLNISYFPDTVHPQILSELETLDFEYRLVSRYINISKEQTQKILEKKKMYYDLKTKSGLQWIMTALNPESNYKEDSKSIANANEADLALSEFKNGELNYGYYTFTLVIFDKDLTELNKKMEVIRKIISFHDFVMDEDRYNTLDAFFGTIPGNIQNNLRRTLLNSYILTAMLPISSVYQGEKRNKHLHDVPLLVTRSNSELFYLNLHVRDIGHTLITGVTGAGKSLLLSMLASQFQKYNSSTKQAQVFFFDKDASSRVITETSGGSFYDLGNTNDIQLQIFKDIDKESEKEFILDWLTNILERENFTVTAEHRITLFNALNSLSNTDVEFRTFTHYVEFVQDLEIKNILKLYTGNEIYGKYFDNDKDTMTNNAFITFEMNEIMNKSKVLEPMLEYLFHRIEIEKLDGTPSIIFLDESWMFLKNPKMSETIEKWLRVLRKKNTSVVFATQSLVEIFNSSLGHIINDSCKTKIFLPNPNANIQKEIYYKFNLKDEEIQVLNDAQMKKDYFYKSELGSRLFSLDLSDIELAYTGSSDSESQRKIIELKDKYKDDIKGLNEEFLKYKLNK